MKDLIKCTFENLEAYGLFDKISTTKDISLALDNCNIRALGTLLKQDIALLENKRGLDIEYLESGCMDAMTIFEIEGELYLSTWSDMMESIYFQGEVLISSSHGQYIPQVFAQYLQDTPKGDYAEEFTIIENPDQDEYWEAWESIVDSFTWEFEGQTYRIFQDEDIRIITE